MRKAKKRKRKNPYPAEQHCSQEELRTFCQYSEDLIASTRESAHDEFDQMSTSPEAGHAYKGPSKAACVTVSAEDISADEAVPWYRNNQATKAAPMANTQLSIATSNTLFSNAPAGNIPRRKFSDILQAVKCHTEAHLKTFNIAKTEESKKTGQALSEPPKWNFDEINNANKVMCFIFFGLTDTTTTICLPDESEFTVTKKEDNNLTDVTIERTNKSQRALNLLLHITHKDNITTKSWNSLRAFMRRCTDYDIEITNQAAKFCMEIKHTPKIKELMPYQAKSLSEKPLDVNKHNTGRPR